MDGVSFDKAMAKVRQVISRAEYVSRAQALAEKLYGVGFEPNPVVLKDE